MYLDFIPGSVRLLKRTNVPGKKLRERFILRRDGRIKQDFFLPHTFAFDRYKNHEKRKKKKKNPAVER